MYKIANKISPKYLIDLFQIQNSNANDMYPTETLLYQNQTLIYLKEKYLLFHIIVPEYDATRN